MANSNHEPSRLDWIEMSIEALISVMADFRQEMSNFREDIHTEMMKRLHSVLIHSF